MYPILEFDEEKNAIINPQDFLKKIEGADYCVITFFKDIYNKIKESENVKIRKIIETGSSDHPLLELEYNGNKIAVLLAGLGGPLSAGLLEELIAYGYSKFIACGSSGVLDGDITRNKIILPIAAIRDEGTSYHYLPPAREVEFDTESVAVVEKVLKKYSIDYLLGKTWTTDAFYRETEAKVQRRKDEGCLCVEMESASMCAVAKFRNVTFAQILYGGDDVSGKDWDIRNLNCSSTREKIFWLAVEACSSL